MKVNSCTSTASLLSLVEVSSILGFISPCAQLCPSTRVLRVPQGPHQLPEPAAAPPERAPPQGPALCSLSFSRYSLWLLWVAVGCLVVCGSGGISAGKELCSLTRANMGVGGCYAIPEAFVKSHIQNAAGPVSTASVRLFEKLFSTT